MQALAQDIITGRGVAVAVSEVALDGKTLRDTSEEGTPLLHMQRAFAQHAG